MVVSISGVVVSITEVEVVTSPIASVVTGEVATMLAVVVESVASADRTATLILA